MKKEPDVFSGGKHSLKENGDAYAVIKKNTYRLTRPPLTAVLLPQKELRSCPQGVTARMMMLAVECDGTGDSCFLKISVKV